MKTVLAAVDNSLAGKPVLATARVLATLLGGEVKAVHVQTNGNRTARSAADAAGIPLHTVTGSVVEHLILAGESRDVVAMVIGARGTHGSRRSLGGTAAAVAMRLHKPVVIVPPEASVPTSFRRVLVPLEGALSTPRTPASIFELADDLTIDVVVLHVLGEDSIPAFTDQPQHEHSAWTREFLSRYSPWRPERVRFETRIGRIDDLVAGVAEQCGCDLIALGWSQELAPGRAAVVRATLRRSHMPVILVPVLILNDLGEDSVRSEEAPGRGR